MSTISARAEAIPAAAIRVLAVSCCAVQLWGCSAQQPPVLYPKGPVALATRDLLFTAAGLMLIVVIPVFILTAFVVWRYRAGASAGRYTPDWGFSWPIDIIVWTVPLAIVAALGFLVWTRTHQLDPYRAIAAPAAPIVVEVVALDWKWLFIYPEQNIASVNRLVFPAGRDVRLKITSDTVMNAFAVPALGGQIYAMAGMQTQLNLLADAPGTFEGHNTQFSGKGFALDRFVAEAVTQQNFDAFVARSKQAAARLDGTTYETLARPTIGAPEQVFGGVDTTLFADIIGKYGGQVTPTVRSQDIAPQP
ncbi:MAG: cytochrome bo3 quinol oxidase subunit 2 [Devosia sp.]|nr:cytochrome bo3 quinol oxidase subunit 2 [Devosia sp.]